MHIISPLLLALLLALPAAAQDQRASREREALRRAQAALQQSQAQRDTLQAEKAQLERDKAGAATSAQTLQRRLAAAQAELARLHDDLARQGNEREAERQRETTARQQAEAAAAEREAGLRQQLAAVRAERDERSAANRAVVAELERRSQALADAQRRVRELHQLGQEAVQRYLDKGAADQALQRDPVFGLAGVRIENVAEDLRMRLDAQRLPATTAQ